MNTSRPLAPVVPLRPDRPEQQRTAHPIGRFVDGLFDRWFEAWVDRAEARWQQGGDTWLGPRF